MRGRLGTDIPEREQLIGLVNDVCGYLPFDDLEKQVVGHVVLRVGRFIPEY
jgi:hypothetical protein